MTETDGSSYAQTQTAGRPPSALSRSVGDAASRIQEIVDTAERVAEEIRLDAQAEASAYLEEQRQRASGMLDSHVSLMLELAGDLSGHADALRAQVERSVQALEQAATRIREASQERPEAPPVGAASPDPGPEEAIVVEEPASPEPVAYGSPAEPPADEEAGAGATAEQPLLEESEEEEEAGAPGPPPEPASEEAALLRATQMAVAGSDRDEIAATLRNELGVRDPDPILDEILGSGR